MPRTLLTGLAGPIGLWLVAVSASVGQGEKAPAPSPEAVRFFESKVRPVLVDHCFQCHADKKQKGSLRLDSRAAMLAGGDEGPVLVPGEPDNSLFIRAVRHAGELKMPPDKKLTREQIADLSQWVKQGAPWPGGDSATTTTVVKKGDKQVTDQDRAHWSFQPVKRPTVPQAKDKAWVRNPIDAFILSKLESKGLRPNPPAERRELVRRAYYNVTGLPPTLAELERALSDQSDNWYEKLVDELLESPRYGEKWARHWLDLVRFAETNSYERDNPKPNTWRYRDWVIRALNQDKPYDRFVREQLAGDELGLADSREAAEALIATGFYRLGIWDDEPTDPVQAKYDGLDDIVATVGQVFLGLTLDCARCHEHKIDPIPHRDYYRFLAFFHNINHFRNGGPSDEQPIFTDAAGKQAYEQRVKALEQRKSELQTPVAVFEEEFAKLYQQVNGKAVPKPELPKLIRAEGAKLLGKERYTRYDEQRRELETLGKQKVVSEMALCVTEAGAKGPDTFVLLRGNPHVKGLKVEPGFPEVLGKLEPNIPFTPPGARSSGRRLALADWIVSPQNPLTARVLVNRLWQHHFGRGIVRSPNNFGFQGDRPTHLELLDWLASELTASGDHLTASGGRQLPVSWSMKKIHRLILTSNAYRMSSRGNAEALKADPSNDLFWRFDMRRLSAEEIRDSVLAVSGNLNLKMFGPGIYPEMPPEVLATQSMPGKGWGKSSPEEQARRSVYVHVKRSLLLPILDSFDLADADRTAAVRFSSTQPTQALLMLNSAFLNKQAGIFAERLKKEAGGDLEKQVRLALGLATCRPPRDAEVKRGLALLHSLREKEGASQEAALKYFCLMVLNLNEFVYLD